MFSKSLFMKQMCLTKLLSQYSNPWLTLLILCNASLGRSTYMKPSLNISTVASFTGSSSPVYEGDVFTVNVTLVMPHEELKEFIQNSASVALNAVEKNVTVITTRIPRCKVRSSANISCSNEYDAFKIFLTFDVSVIYSNQNFQIKVLYKNTSFDGELLRSPQIRSLPDLTLNGQIINSSTKSLSLQHEEAELCCRDSRENCYAVISSSHKEVLNSSLACATFTFKPGEAETYNFGFILGGRRRESQVQIFINKDSLLYENVNIEILDEKGERIMSQKTILKNYRMKIVSNMTVRALQRKSLVIVEIDMTHMFIYLPLWACYGLNDNSTLSCVISGNTITAQVCVQASKELSEKDVRFKLKYNGTHLNGKSVRLPSFEDESITFNNKSLNNDPHNVNQQGHSALPLTIFGLCLVGVVLILLLTCWCYRKKNVCPILPARNPDPEWV